MSFSARRSVERKDLLSERSAIAQLLKMQSIILIRLEQNANEGDKAKRSRSHENSYSSDAFEDEDDGSKKDHGKCPRRDCCVHEADA